MRLLGNCTSMREVIKRGQFVSKTTYEVAQEREKTQPETKPEINHPKF